MSARVDRWVARHPLVTEALLMATAFGASIVVNLFVQPPLEDFWSPWQIPACVAVVAVYCVLGTRLTDARRRGEAALKDES